MRYAVAGDQLREDVAVERIISVRPIDHLFAVDIDVGMRHRAVEDEGIELILIHFDAGAVMALAHPRQTTATAGLPGRLFLAVLHDDHFLQVIGPVERTADGPVVRNNDIFPSGIFCRVLCELPLTNEGIRANRLFGAGAKQQANDDRTK